MLAIFGMGGWETILVLMVFLVLLATRMNFRNREGDESGPKTFLALVVISACVIGLYAMSYLLEWLSF